MELKEDGDEAVKVMLEGGGDFIGPVGSGRSGKKNRQCSMKVSAMQRWRAETVTIALWTYVCTY